MAYPSGAQTFGHEGQIIGMGPIYGQSWHGVGMQSWVPCTHISLHGTWIRPCVPRFCLALPGSGFVCLDPTFHCLDKAACAQILLCAMQISHCTAFILTSDLACRAMLSTCRTTRRSRNLAAGKQYAATMPPHPNFWTNGDPSRLNDTASQSRSGLWAKSWLAALSVS